MWYMFLDMGSRLVVKGVAGLLGGGSDSLGHDGLTTSQA